MMMNEYDISDAPEDVTSDDVASEEAVEIEAPEVNALEEENARLKDQLLRTMAEMENFKKRAERELQDMAKYAKSEFANDLLAVSDNLRRALESIDPAEIKDNKLIQNVVSGVEMTESELLRAFEKHGIIKIDPMGEKFDHNEHQAMFEEEAKDTEAGMVVKVLQPGYKLHARLLRPAMVGVSKQ